MITMHDATRVVHAGLPAPERGAAIRPSPVFTSTYHLSGDPAGAAYAYGRYANPTWSHFEEAVGELEGGEVVAFASGMAAVSAVLGAVLRPGDVLVMPSDGYYTARLLTDGYFTEIGVTVRYAPTAGEVQADHLEGARLLWIETPSNPGLDVCDVRKLVLAARTHGTQVAVDNTSATPLGQRPLLLGADFSVASDTKALSGHSDLLLGHVAVSDSEQAKRVRLWRTQIGAIPGPMEVWLAHRSLSTLDVRLERMCSNALAIATFLSTRPEVRAVRYPGLASDPSYEVAARQMTRFGPIVSFELADQAAADRFLTASRLITETTSFGGVHTTAERRARWGGDMVPAGFIRLSAGLEHPSDLLEDLAAALETGP